MYGRRVLGDKLVSITVDDKTDNLYTKRIQQIQRKLTLLNKTNKQGSFVGPYRCNWPYSTWHVLHRK